MIFGATAIKPRRDNKNPWSRHSGYSRAELPSPATRLRIALPASAPGLKRQDRPHCISPVALAADVIRPHLSYGAFIEKSTTELLRIEQILRPLPQRAAQP